MTVTDVEDIYELSPLQEGMLFHCLSDPRPGIYLEQFSYSLSGDLDLPAFTAAWRHVLRRHEVLRTSLHWQGAGKPLQVVHREVELPLIVHDWSDIAESDRERRLAELLASDRRQRFDFAQAPLLRVAVARAAPRLHYFLWTFHHILMDGWSIAIVLHDLFAGYAELRRGGVPPLERPRPFRDHILSLQAQDSERSRAFWARLLEGFAEPLSIELDSPRSGSGPPAGEPGERELRLDAEQTAALQAGALGLQVTLNTLVQGSWALLLSRYCGVEDVVFGTTVSGRSAGGMEDTVGLFINTLPTRVRVPAQSPVRPWLQGLQRLQAEMREHESTPLPQIQGWSGVRTGTPLFETLVIYESYPAAPATGAADCGLELHHLHTREQMNYPLALVVVPDQEMLFRLSYDQRRFDGMDMERLLSHLVHVLHGLVASPGRALGAVPMLGRSEEQFLLRELNDAEVAAADRPCVHDLFAISAAAAPDAVAVSFGDVTLTRAEVSRRVRRLAECLRARGVGPEVRVGVFLDRSERLPLALLGVLAAGGAYVPLDPKFPRQRLALMLEDAGPAVLLTERRLVAALPTGAAQVLAWEDLPLAGPSPAAAGATPAVLPSNLAYVIYTSGSTGRPKGVAVPHSALSNLLTAMQRRLQATAGDVLLAVTTVSFDIAALEIFLPLISGARLAVAAADEVPDALRLLARMEREGTTLLQATPATWRALIEAGWEGTPGLTALCGGEALPGELASALRERSAALWNVYGPTETTVWSSMERIRAEAEATISLGRPIDDTRLYVLDPSMQLLPLGAAGSLFIGGGGLARGYHGLTGLTAERFVPDPFADSPGGRLYDTGDVARRRRDGALIFLGRSDRQVKRHGFRIEVGEIESALCRHAEVKQAVVTAHRRTGPVADLQLVAWFVPESRTPDAPELRAWLRHSLPEYMLPSRFVPLPAFPLTPNGKVDRKALVPPEEAAAEVSLRHVLPRTPLEEVLADVWAEVLEVPRLGVEDHFVERGGDSLLALRAALQIQEALQVEITPDAIFKNPTVARLAAALTLDPVEGRRLLREAELFLRLAGLSDEEAAALFEPSDTEVEGAAL